ncbi:MAG: tetratricopeptide repeat protein, partial [Pseudomonadota bacterium]
MMVEANNVGIYSSRIVKTLTKTLAYYFLLCSFSSAATDDLISKGTQAYQSGTFDVAVTYWREALEAPRTLNEAVQLSIQLAHALQAQGQIEEAAQVLKKSVALENLSYEQLAVLHATLSAFHLLLDQPETAGRYLEQIDFSALTESPAIAALMHYTQAQVMGAQGYTRQVEEHYQRAITWAEQSSDKVLQCKSYLALALIKTEQGPLEHAVNCLKALPDSYEKHSLMLSMSHQLHRQQKAYSIQHSLFQQILKFAESSGQGFLSAYAYGYLGKLYEARGRFSEAIPLMRQAIFQARKHAPTSILIGRASYS